MSHFLEWGLLELIDRLGRGPGKESAILAVRQSTVMTKLPQYLIIIKLWKFVD